MSRRHLQPTRWSPTIRNACTYLIALSAPLALSVLVHAVPGWPKPYSWQYLGVSLATAIVFGTGPGVVTLAVAAVSVLWLGVPTPVHPGVEMFVGIDAALLMLLRETRRSRQRAAEVISGLNANLERQNAELETDRAELQQANRRLAEADRRKDEYLSMLSHELRNPLAAVVWAVNLIARDPAAQGDLKRLSGVAARQAANMARMLDDLLDVARMTRGHISLRAEPIDLASVVAGAVETVQPKIDARGHRLSVTLPRDPLVVRGDAVRLSQVVANLLDNAAKYTPNDGHIRVAAEREAGEAVIRVTDSGRGISPDALARVFQPLERREVSAGSAEGGLGLGLALAERLVELHAGHIEAHSDGPGTGSEFVVRLPAVRRSEDVQPHDGTEGRSTGS